MTSYNSQTTKTSGPYYVIVDDDNRMTATCYGPYNATGKGYIAVSETDYNTLLHQPGPGAKINPDGTIATLDVIFPLATLRARLAQITASKKGAGVYFQPSGTSAAVLFPSDEASYTNTLQQAQVVQLGAWTDGTQWALADGTFLPINGDDVTALFKKMAKYQAACQNHAAALSKQLESDLNTDLTEGWPDNH